ncbi:MAG: 4-alpha-glucanotransferase [Candidatus Wallbacteria bacterium]
MRFERSFGVLMHPTSLPGRHGIGDLGENAYKFMDYLFECGAKLWQVMPLGPTGFGDSPYACFSAIAGNPLLISPEKLIEMGLISASEIPASGAALPENYVDFGPAINYKYEIYKIAYKNFKASKMPQSVRVGFEAFRNDNSAWLIDYAMFMALKDKHNGAVWSTWDHAVVKRENAALQKVRTDLKDQIEFYEFLQFLFFKQWNELKEYANKKGIKIIGDIPIFVAYDSADVWANPGIFYLDENGRSTVVAGVPPDFFSETGQLWGNPLYNWDILKKRKFDWWIKRFNETLKIVDILRIDHFRGFEAYWEVGAGEKTAIKGKWIKAPGMELFKAVNDALHKAPIIAEDLGVITPEVEAIRDAYNFPGMKILQFAFGDDSKNKFLPHNFCQNCVVYTGTHDNETTAGWFKNLCSKERASVLDYIGTTGENIHWDMIKLAISSTADIAIIPVQDIIGAGDEGRMNTPGKAAGNWGYRFKFEQLNNGSDSKLMKLCKTYNR